MTTTKLTEANLDAAKRKYVKARTAYYNSEPLLTDAEFDKLEDSIKRLDPQWKEFQKTGVKVADKKVEVPLEEYMPSLNKMYPEAVDKFYNRPSSKKVKNWIWMDKLDGTSLQLVYYRGEPTRLITRGDGTLGGDISFFISHLVKMKLIPSRIPVQERVVFRIEGLMDTYVFEKTWASKFENIRNMVNGLFNRKDMHPALKHVSLVVLGVYGKTLPEGLKKAETWGFDIVVHHEVTSLVSDKAHLTAALKNRRAYSGYEMDGLVVAPSDWVMNYDDAEKPKALIAFKFNDDEGATEVKVLEEIWTKTRLNRWSCKVRIPPTKMDGVTVQNATAHNPQWMKERGIGKGAIIKVLRSGGVIPKIVSVVKAGKFQGPPGEYEERGRFFYGVETDKVSEVRALHHFLKTMGVELLAQKSVARMYDAGYTTAAQYVEIAVTGRKRDAAAAAHFHKAGFGPVESAKKVQQLVKAFSGPVSLKMLMVASGSFESIGEKKLASLEEQGVAMAAMLKWKVKDWTNMEISELEGFKDKTVASLMNGVYQFKTWFESIKDMIEVNGDLPAPKAKRQIKGKLTGIKVAFTSYRDKEQEAQIVSLGGEVVAYSTKMDVLLYKTGAKFVAKIEKAGAKAMTWEQFTKKYGV